MDFREKQKKKLTLTTRKKSIAKQRTLFKSKYKIIFINKKAEEEKKLENKRIYFRTKQTNKTQNRDIKPRKGRSNEV